MRHKTYSRHDPVLKFADKTYPFIHMVQFPELFDPRLKRGDTNIDCTITLRIDFLKYR